MFIWALLEGQEKSGSFQEHLIHQSCHSKVLDLWRCSIQADPETSLRARVSLSLLISIHLFNITPTPSFVKAISICCVGRQRPAIKLQGVGCHSGSNYQSREMLSPQQKGKMEGVGIMLPCDLCTLIWIALISYKEACWIRPESDTPTSQI